MQFKSNQTAAAYVAHELDELTQEAFEVHMMGCSECLNDVEAWRVIKTHMPDAVVLEPARQFKKHWWGGWGMAASFIGALAIVGAGSYYSGTLQRPDLDSSEIAFFDMQPVTRSESCTQLPVAANTRAVVLRMTKVDSERHPLATNLDGMELASNQYNVRAQRDGSWVLRFEPEYLKHASAYIVTRKNGTEDESLGCISAAVAPPVAELATNR
ncbi:MAG TPA: zf-HC2 domain-containing protein [Polyangiales bacterium]|nr:zf-HC2 domain-containing protein [Polyangiales bacterium]